MPKRLRKKSIKFADNCNLNIDNKKLTDNDIKTRETLYLIFKEVLSIDKLRILQLFHS